MFKLTLRKPESSNAAEYCVFVFVRDVLIGTAIRFRNFELVPTQSGLDSRDPLDFVNWFLRECLVNVNLDNRKIESASIK